MTKAMRTTESQDVVNVEDIDLSEYQNATDEGFEEFSSENIRFPLVKLIQKTSDEILNKHSNARIGDFYHNINDEVYPANPGLVVSLLYYNNVYVEMIPFSEGGGVLGFHDKSALNSFPFNRQKGCWISESGEIIESHYHYVRLWEPVISDAIIILSKTQLKVSNMWLTRARSLRINGFSVPMYVPLYRISSEDTRTKSGIIKSWKIGMHERKVGDKEQIETAKGSYQMIKQNRERIILEADSNFIVEEVY